MVQVFRDEHLGQEPRGRDTFIDDMRGNRSLDQSLAAPADPFAADVTLDFEHPRGVIEFLTHILADALELTAAVALRGLRLVTDLPVRQLRRQLQAARLCFGRRGRLSLSASISRLMASRSASMLSSRRERCTASSCSLRRA